MSTLLFPALNLSMLIALLTYFLRRPVIQYSRDRHVRLRDELALSKKQLEEAKAKLEEANSHMRALGTEVSTLRAQLAEEASRVAQKVQSNAQAASSSILQDARRASESLTTEFKRELREELATRITQRAGMLLSQKLTADGREKVRRDFVGYLGATS